jgi:2-dehydropantoate 2-reductase
MRIAIAGPGALGCLLAAALARHDQHEEADQILLIDHRPERAQALDRQGIVCHAGEQEEQIRLPVSAEPETIGPVDILIVCVKAHDLSQSLTFCRALFNANTLIVLMQNGISHLDIEEEIALPTPPAFTTTTEGATLLASGVVRHSGRGQTFSGFLHDAGKPQTLLLQALCTRLTAGGLTITQVDDIRNRLWAKLLINAGINGLTALYNRTNGQLLTSCAARSRLKRIVAEGAEVARAAGVILPTDPIRSTILACTKTAANVSSMLQDVRRKRRTEIMAINGAIIEQGRRLGVPTPLNEELVRQIRKLEESYAN